MPGIYKSRAGDLETLFIEDFEIIDQYAATGSLWLWGRNSVGQLADGGTFIDRSSPIQTVSGGTNWNQVSSGSNHTAAIKTDGTLWLWGNGSTGQLGNNSTSNRLSPVQTVSGGTNWKQVVGGTGNTAAIKTDGTLWLWGYNLGGELGDTTTTIRSSPVQTVSGGTNWKQVSSGEYRTAAIKTDGTLWLWGTGNYGVLGNNFTNWRSSPVQTVSGGTNWKQVSCGRHHTAAIKTDGTLWLWGRNNYGQLGNNSTTNVSSPIQTVSAGTNWKQVSNGSDYITAIKTDGTLWAWGENTFGELGTNSTTNVSSPVQTVAGGANWKQISGGVIHTAAIYFYDAGNLYPSA